MTFNLPYNGAFKIFTRCVGEAKIMALLTKDCLQRMIYAAIQHASIMVKADTQESPNEK